MRAGAAIAPEIVNEAGIRPSTLVKIVNEKIEKRNGISFMAATRASELTLRVVSATKLYNFPNGTKAIRRAAKRPKTINTQAAGEKFGAQINCSIKSASTAIFKSDLFNTNKVVLVKSTTNEIFTAETTQLARAIWQIATNKIVSNATKNNVTKCEKIIRSN